VIIVSFLMHVIQVSSVAQKRYLVVHW